jgi:hypothetical protein
MSLTPLINTVGFRAVNANIINATINNLTNPVLSRVDKVIKQFFVVNNVGVITGFTTQGKNLICDTVNNYCPYYCDVSGVNFNQVRNLNDLVSSDNNNSFFQEEILETDLDNYFTNSEENTSDFENNLNRKLLSGNFSDDYSLESNTTQHIEIANLHKGRWMFNGNVNILLPPNTNLSGLLLQVYLDDQKIPFGEINLGSHESSNNESIKSSSYNFIFDSSKIQQLKLALTPISSSNPIKVLNLSNYFISEI